MIGRNPRDTDDAKIRPKLIVMIFVDSKISVIYSSLQLKVLFIDMIKCFIPNVILNSQREWVNRKMIEVESAW